MELVHFIPKSQRLRVLEATQNDPQPTLIVGASGTGKSAIARWIHRHSRRATLPLTIATKDLPLTQQLLDTQGGTLFIDEIGTWPLTEQKVLVDFLKTRSIPTEGPNPLRQILNVRIMAGTSQDLTSRTTSGLFNADLFAILSVYRLDMPSLAERMEEFSEIALGILEETARELHREHLRSFSAAAWEKLQAYSWPGNIRELRNVLRVAAVKAKGECIDASDLPAFGPDQASFMATREEFERTYWTELLKSFDWQIDLASEATRIDKISLLAKINRYGIALKDQSITK